MPEPSEEQLGGRGLWLIARLADHFTVTTLPGGGSRVEAEFALAAPPMRLPPSDEDEN